MLFLLVVLVIVVVITVITTITMIIVLHDPVVGYNTLNKPDCCAKLMYFSWNFKE